MKTMKKRVLVSFDDICPYQCKHCYTLDIRRTGYNRTVSEIVDSLESQEFDVVYVSQRRDNFTDPNKGIELCEKIYEKYCCNIFIITRNVLNDEQIARLLLLKNNMEKNEKKIIVACSVFATKSYAKSENPNVVPSPYERLNFIKHLQDCGMKSFVIIRPVFPNSFIPVDELFELIDECKKNNTCVVSSGLAVNDNICWRLGLNSGKMHYLNNIHYLEGAMEGKLQFIDVEIELAKLRQYCQKQGVAFFEHTLQALNYVAYD